MATTSNLIALEQEYAKLRDIIINADAERSRLISSMRECLTIEDLYYQIGVFVGSTKDLSNVCVIHNFESFYQRETLPFDTELINDNNNEMEK